MREALCHPPQWAARFVQARVVAVELLAGEEPEVAAPQVLTAGLAE